jgi:hypothetical protein
MTGITEGLVAEEFMRRMAKPMSTTNKDGIGYSAVASDGELFSQRWLNNSQFFDKTEVMTPAISEQLASFASRLPKGALELNYSEFGNINFQDVKSVTMHTRFATCGREFANTHPFIDADTSLIHNGSISNAFSTHYRVGLDINKISTCDSEAALQTYLKLGVNLDTSQAKKWLDLLTGSWAFGILSRNQQNNRILDVIRGTSMLYYMEVDGIGKIFTTNDDDAKAVIKDMGLTYVKEPIFVASDEMYRYDAITGEFLDTVDIKTVYKTYGSQNTKTRGTGSGTSGSSSTNTNSTSTKNTTRNGEALLALVDSLRDDPDAMALLPDIFTAGSTQKDLKIDYRKVKKHTNDQSHPFIDRLSIFDLVFSSRLLDMYEALPSDLRTYIRDVDDREGMKAARSLIVQLNDKKTLTMG